MVTIYVKALLCFSLFIFILAIPMVEAIDKSPRGVETWFAKLNHKKEKIAKLHFYYHYTTTGQNPTSYAVAQSEITATTPTFFGLVRVNDELLTVGPDPNSATIGRAQGLFALASLEDEVALAMSANLVFTNQKFNGSTLNLVGRNAIMNEYREMSIVGGTGYFRLARGIATAKTVWSNQKTHNAVVEYHVIVMYY